LINEEFLGNAEVGQCLQVAVETGPKVGGVCNQHCSLLYLFL